MNGLVYFMWVVLCELAHQKIYLGIDSQRMNLRCVTNNRLDLVMISMIIVRIERIDSMVRKLRMWKSDERMDSEQLQILLILIWSISIDKSPNKNSNLADLKWKVSTLSDYQNEYDDICFITSIAVLPPW